MTVCGVRRNTPEPATTDTGRGITEIGLGVCAAAVAAMTSNGNENCPITDNIQVRSDALERVPDLPGSPSSVSWRDRPCYRRHSDAEHDTGSTVVRQNGGWWLARRRNQ